MGGSRARVRDGRLWLPALRGVARGRSAILGYHGVGSARRGEDLSRLQVSPERFEAQLRLLLDAGFRFVTVADLVGRMNGGAPPPGLAVVSFDDGMRNNRTTALPILARLGIPATVYVAVGFIDGHSPWVTGPGGEMMSREEIRELAASGWEIGAHTMTHPDMASMTYAECRGEMEASRDALEQIVEAEISTFAYPFGRYGPAAVAAARDSGFAAAVTTGSGKWDAHELTRAMVSAGDPFPVLMLKLTDRYEPLLASRPIRSTRDASKRVRDRLRRRATRP